MSGVVASSQANNRSWRLARELMFQEAMRISVAAAYDRRIVSDNLPSALIERRYSSSSTPLAGTKISVAGSAADNVARFHSTAGGSPCTRTILPGESFLA